jgi:hypothetical protein
VPVSNIKIIAQERNIEISSPVLSRMLFTSYLASSSSNLSNLYINDIVRNVDLKSLLKENKTGNYIIKNFELVKTAIWDNFQIDIYKPQALSNLSDIQINNLCELLQQHDSSVAKRFLVKQFSDIVRFYHQLSQELNDIRK